MATSKYSCYPTLITLLNDGEMSFDDLVTQIRDLDSQRFKDVDTIKTAITNYCSCLELKNNHVKYLKDSKNYTKYPEIFEKEIEYFLHTQVPNMKEWELYPYYDRKKEPVCALHIPWKYIPVSMLEGTNIEKVYQDNCDMFIKSRSCTGKCGVNIKKIPEYQKEGTTLIMKNNFDFLGFIERLEDEENDAFPPF